MLFRSNDTATTEIYTLSDTLSLHDALPIIPVDAIAVPNGAWNRRILLECAAAGYRRVYTSDPFLRRVEKTGIEVIGRFSVKRTMSPSALEKLARAERNAFSGARIRHRAKCAIRATLGRRLYHRLWCWFAQVDSQGRNSGTYEDAPTSPI